MDDKPNKLSIVSDGTPRDTKICNADGSKIPGVTSYSVFGDAKGPATLTMTVELLELKHEFNPDRVEGTFDHDSLVFLRGLPTSIIRGIAADLNAYADSMEGECSTES